MDFSIWLYGFTSKKRSSAYFHEFRILELAFEEQPPRAKRPKNSTVSTPEIILDLTHFFSLFFFSYFFPIILYRVFFPRLWASFDTIIFLLLFPTRFILFYFFFFILIPAEVTIEAHMFSEPFVLRCFTTETSYKQEKLVLSFSHFSFKKVSRILPDESWFLTAKDQRSYKLKFKSYIQKMYR